MPEGYSLGDHRGLMRRAPRSSSNNSELAPNPDWIQDRPTNAIDALLRQAAHFERDFTFAALRVPPGADTRELNRSLLPLNAEIVGDSGYYLRVAVPAERRRLEAIAELPGVLGIGAVPPELKAGQAFAREMLSRPAADAAPVFISLMAPDPAGEWREKLTEFGLVVGAYDADLRSYTANMPPSALEQLLAADFVLSVEPVPAVKSNHASAVPVMGVDGLRVYNDTGKDFSGATGAGIAVGVLDTGLNLNHVDIAHGRDSVCGANFYPDEDWDLWLDLGQHGTHVFGTIAGAGRANPLLAGMAPELSHLRFGKVLSARGWGSGDDIRRGMDYLARPTSCGWRGGIADAVKPLIVNMSLAATSLAFSGRGVGERKLDSVVHAYSQLYVVAQANAGLHGFSNYGTAKNSLAVGAIEDSGLLASFSSHGPTADGRLAPNVVAAGVDLTSAKGGGSVSAHNTLSGTSMAAPSVAGVAALLMQARPEFRHQPALARARLMASAVRPEIHLQSDAQFPRSNSDGPGRFNHLYGLGLVSARTSLYSRDNPAGWRIGSAVSRPDDGDYEYIDVEVPSGARRLDVVLTWDEQPADTLTRSVLNDLDLWVDRDGDCGSDACGEYASRSKIDNVEWLLIEDPVPGTYRIKVVPVEVYGEQSTAAAAWKIVRGEATPQLELRMEDVSQSAASDFVTVEVGVNASDYVASGTTLHLGCDSVRHHCLELGDAYLPGQNRIYRADGLFGSESNSPSDSIPLGEIAAGTPKRVRLAFLRERVPAGSALLVTASSWNGKAATRRLTLLEDEPPGEFAVAANDDFSTPTRIEGAAGETVIDFASASREPGEQNVSADSRTLWYAWRAPARGLFRFGLEDAETGAAEEADFALFTGDNLVALELAAGKRGAEISFAAQASVEYRLRVAQDGLSDWHLAPLTLKWESADARPPNDDFANAREIEGATGSLASNNEGATLEGSEFWGGSAATVWFEWEARWDGPWLFDVDSRQLVLRVFDGSQVENLRLLSQPGNVSAAAFVARRGKTYKVAVASESADDSGRKFGLSWRPLSFNGSGRYMASSDHFSDARAFAGEQGSVSVTRHIINGFTVEPDEPVETGIGTAWLQWTAPSSGKFTWRLEGHSALRFSVFTGDTPSRLQLAGSARGGSKITLDASRNTLYRIAVGQSSSFLRRRSPDMFTVHWGPAPANDDRANAVPISGAGGSIEAGLAHATDSPRDPNDTVGAESVWWRWRAANDGWHRFWVEGHPLSVILSMYSDAGNGQAAAHSERSFLANGRVEAFVKARAGQSYDIRLALRPGVEPASSAALRWEAAGAPAFLSYRGATATDALVFDGRPQFLRSPRNLALNSDGGYLASTAENGLFVFRRDAETGALTLAYRLETGGASGDIPAYSWDRAQLWWNDGRRRLFALTESDGYSFAFSDDGASEITYEEIEGYPGGRSFSLPSPGGYKFGVDGSDGQFFYGLRHADNALRVYRIDAPAEFTLEQIVSPRDAPPGVESLRLNDLRAPADALLSPDGSLLYVLAESGLYVFAVDSASGKLGLRREIRFAGGADGLFQELDGLERLAIDSRGQVLFVAGPPSDSISGTSFLGAAVAAFDIDTDPSNPRRLGGLTRLHAELNSDVDSSWSHLKPGRFESLSGCDSMAAHADLPAVDVFCANGWYVAHWNRDAAALEVADFAYSGRRDRFGAALPDSLGDSRGPYRQLAQSPDGGRAYLTSRVGWDGGFDAIHTIERAGASGFDPDAYLSSVSGSAPGSIGGSGDSTGNRDDSTDAAATASRPPAIPMVRQRPASNSASATAPSSFISPIPSPTATASTTIPPRPSR